MDFTMLILFGNYLHNFLLQKYLSFGLCPCGVAVDNPLFSLFFDSNIPMWLRPSPLENSGFWSKVLVKGSEGLPWWLRSKESDCQCRRCRRCDQEDPLGKEMAFHSRILFFFLIFIFFY